MLEIKKSKTFKRDFKRIKKQGKDLGKLFFIIDCLARQQELAHQYRDHVLTGNWKGHRECHIEPDWLLIYEIIDGELILRRTGSHSDLFK